MEQELTHAFPAAGWIELTDVPPSEVDKLVVVEDLAVALSL